jgi:hypothetical protein
LFDRDLDAGFIPNETQLRGGKTIPLIAWGYV